MSRLPLLLLTAVALAALPACDSGSAVDPPTPADIAGTYEIAEFRFQPDAPAISAVSLLDTLAVSATTVQVLDGGSALLLYRLRGPNQSQRVIQGSVEVRREQVRLTFNSGTDTERRRLLLPPELIFNRDGAMLAASTATRVNLEAYDPAGYGTSGVFTDVPGKIVLRLSPVSTDA